jgi:hypothetical protein
MEAIFGGGQDVQTPTPPAPPPPAPTIDEARRRREQTDAMSRKRGRQASVFTGPDGVQGPQPVATKTLVGS